MSQTFKLPKLVTDLLEFEDLVARAEADPLGLIDHCLRRSKEYDEGARWMHWSLLISLYAAALVINRDPELIAKLLSHACFKDAPYRRNGKYVLRLVVLAGQGISSKGKLYKNACHDASMMQPFFKDQIEPIALFSMIVSQRGLKGLAQILDPSDIGEQEDADNAAASDGTGDAEQSDDQPSGLDEEPIDVNPAHRPVERKIAEKAATESRLDDVATEKSVGDATVIIELEITQKRLERLNRAPAGSTGHIVFRRTSGGADTKSVKVTSLKIDH